MTHKPLNEDSLTKVLLAMCSLADDMKYDVDSPLNDSTTLIDVIPPIRLAENDVLLNSETDHKFVLGSDDIEIQSELVDNNNLNVLKTWGYKDE